MSPCATARFATGIFFPGRSALKLDGRSYSPCVLEKAMLCAGRDPAYHLAAATLDDVGDISISGRHLRNLTVQIGGELQRARDAKIDTYFQSPLPHRCTLPQTPLALACVGMDGGRMQTRRDGGTGGVQVPHWRETKNGQFMRMTGVRFDEDPHPQLPECFRDRQYMKKLLSGLVSEGEFSSGDAPPGRKSDLRSWRPERVFRTCLSSLCDSDSFGRMMEVEADSRGFYAADKRAFVGDGLPCNWTIQKRHFPTFTPILDFPHAMEWVHQTAKAVREDSDAAWQLYVHWVSACWEGRVKDMLGEMRLEQQRIGSPPEDADQSDPRQMLDRAITYFQNNSGRMDYPRYRREGLPITSAHMESLVKEVNYRVKGTEKFWNDGPAGEAILQVRAAVLCDDKRLQTHMRS